MNFFRSKKLACVIGAVIVLWGLNGFVGMLLGLSDAGTFGDQFGAVNSLFSGLAFVGLIYTIFLQRNSIEQQRQSIELQREDLKNQQEELRLNRNELEMARQEMENHTAEFQRQNDSLRVQRFDNTFFNMMELQQQIVNGLSLKIKVPSMARFGSMAESISDTDYSGRGVFDGAFNGLPWRPGLSFALKKDGLIGYDDSENRTLFDHYFRHLYSILKFIDETKVFDSEDLREVGESVFEAKYRYTSILRSTLSRYELVLLYYNGLSSVGKEKLKPLLEKYCMLNNLNYSLLILNKDTLESIGLPVDVNGVTAALQNVGLSGTDFEILLTTDYSNTICYHIDAFCHTDAERAEMQRLLRLRDERLNSVRSMF